MSARTWGNRLSAIGCRLSALALVCGTSLLAISSASAQPPMPPPPAQQPLEYQIQLEPPGPQRVFRLESEKALFERVRQEARDRNERADFPTDPVVATEGQTYQPGRPWPARSTVLVPYVVCYNPLYFEEKNSERYGWDWSIFQPIVSTGAFYADVIIFPYNFGVQPCWACECNSGYALPGDPMPYHFYIPPFSWKGALLEAGVIAGGFAVLP